MIRFDIRRQTESVGSNSAELIYLGRASKFVLFAQARVFVQLVHAFLALGWA